ncbi:MAG: hypothetical protein QG574_4086 [Cyanobacteriota bacterium erpe_2018_sw_21hr_WHONDRS-SW48-000092_B_bin.40]|jgi:hypothetical protein|nr:hypothetical protein [Cyanobacteriota bacterium erpe_2018_sw_21hr_WHONDRS-SW48-000092_B_bin.40]
MSNVEIERVAREIENEASLLGGAGDFPVVLQIIVIGSIGFLGLYFLSFFLANEVFKLTDGIGTLTVPAVEYVFGCAIATYIMKKSYRKAIIKRCTDEAKLAALEEDEEVS